MDEEYRIERGTNSHVQKVLNQWRHDYHLNILGFQASDDMDDVAVLLTRIKKTPSVH